MLFPAYLDIDCWGGYTLGCLFPNFLVISFENNLSFISICLLMADLSECQASRNYLSFLDLSLSKMLTVFQLKLWLVLSSDSEIKEFSCLLIARWYTILCLPVAVTSPVLFAPDDFFCFFFWVFGFALGVLYRFHWVECYSDIRKWWESVRCLWKVQV